MKLVKAGESHGKQMVGILANVPAGITVEKKFLNNLLKERSIALGRSERQTFERDKIDLLTGVRGGVTIGNNVAFAVKNAAYDKNIMGNFECDEEAGLMLNLRPGHADFGGLERTGFCDARSVAEGASARSTCIDALAGGIAIQMLKMLEIEVVAFVRSFGDILDEKNYSFNELTAIKAPAFTLNKNFALKCKQKINEAKLQGNSLGGTVEIWVKAIKPGFGSYVAEKRVNSVIAQLIMQLQAVKGLYFGENPFAFNGGGVEYVGSLSLSKSGKIIPQNSLAGGINGGMTDGDVIKITVAVKPIPTTQAGVKSVNYKTGDSCISEKVRSDTTAVFALCPVIKGTVALALSECICERLGCDNMQAIIKRYENL
ncbi:MAG: chorismate synthase [Clostridia bacterium]|nr:chorismate synthase [Clostridia bacterium]